MNPILKTGIVALLLTTTPTVFAAWDELGTSEFITVLIDKASVKKSGDKVQVLSMLDLKKPGVEPKTKTPVSSIIGLNEYHCGQVQYRPLEVRFISGKRGTGKVIDEIKTPESAFEPVVSGDWAAGVYNFACRAN